MVLQHQHLQPWRAGASQARKPCKESRNEAADPSGSTPMAEHLREHGLAASSRAYEGVCACWHQGPGAVTHGTPYQVAARGGHRDTLTTLRRLDGGVGCGWRGSAGAGLWM